MSASARVALLAAAIPLGVASEVVSHGAGEVGDALADLLVGWTWVGCAAVVSARRPAARVGALMAATGMAWLAGGFSSALLYVHRGPLWHALLAFPGGRLSRRRDQGVVALAYVDGAIAPVARSAIVTIGLSVLAAAVAVDAAGRETGVRRRARVASTAGAVAVAVVLAAGAAGRLADAGTDLAALHAYEVVLVAVATALAGDLLRARWTTGAVTGLVVDLGGIADPFTLRDRLARAVGDRSLVLGYRLDEDGGYVDDAGRAVVAPGPGSGRAVTPIEREGERVAILVHDPAVLRDRALVDAVAAATRIAVENARLQARVRAGVEQVAASRRRIVEAADAQRRRLARELHDGAQRRLAAVAGHIDALGEAADGDAERELMADARRQLAAARDELVELARGIRPTALTGGGLPAALPELAARSPVPVDVDVAAGRVPAAIEAAAYFVCAEGLANVAKYASASRARVQAREAGDRLVVVVVDDGAGGADPSRGSGLRGLADRVEALGGRLEVSSPPGGGTRLRADLPAG